MEVTLKAARINAHISQQRMADTIGVSTTTLRSWENDRTFPDAVQLRRMCRLYNVKMDDIILPV